MSLSLLTFIFFLLICGVVTFFTSLHKHRLAENALREQEKKQITENISSSGTIILTLFVFYHSDQYVFFSMCLGPFLIY